MRPTLLLLLLVPGVARAATLSVGPGQPYATVAAAVADAVSGDVIEVDAGSYTEFFDVSVDVEIVGLGGAAGTTLTATNEDIIEVFGADVTIRGFTFRPNGARAVDIDGGSLVLDDIVVSGNTSSDRDGGAVRVQNATAAITASTFDGNGTASEGGHLAVYDGDVTVTDCTFVGGTAVEGGAVVIGGGSLVLDTVTLQDNEAIAGGAIRADDATVELVGSTVEGNLADGYGGWGAPDTDGGAVYATASALVITGSTFVDNEAANIGGALTLQDGADASVDGSTFDGNRAAYGGAIYLGSSGSMSVTGSTFTDNLALVGAGGAIRWRSDFGTPAIDLVDTLFSGNAAVDYGGALAYATNNGPRGTATFTDCTFTGNAGDLGGAMSVTDVPTVIGVRNLFCANEAGTEGGGVRLRRSGDDQNLWTNNVFDANSASGPGGGLFLLEGGRATVANNSFVANAAGDGGAARFDTNAVDFQNNLVAWTTGGSGVTAVNAAGGSLDYNAWWDNTPGDVGGAIAAVGANAVLADPLVSAFVLDEDCANDALWPLAGSPLVDAGNPIVGDDPNGTPPDIGAYGGPEASLDVLTDDDGDGFTAAVDCNDADPLVNPDAVETCNGVDDDCDGTVDGAEASGATTFYGDTDGDGWGGVEVLDACEPPPGYVSDPGDCDDTLAAVNPGAEEVCNAVDDDCDGAVDEELAAEWYADLDGDGYGDPDVSELTCDPDPGLVDNGDDCDDADAAVNPAAEDPEGDDLDANCDGVDGVALPPDPYATEALVAGCACSSASGGPSGAWLGLLLLLGLRRRR